MEACTHAWTVYPQASFDEKRGLVFTQNGDYCYVNFRMYELYRDKSSDAFVIIINFGFFLSDKSWPSTSVVFFARGYLGRSAARTALTGREMYV